MVNSSTTGQLLIIDFYSPDCGPCQTMVPVWEEIKNNYKNQIDFAEIDVSSHPPISLKYRIKTTPTFILFFDGKEIWRHAGLITFKRMKEYIDSIILLDG